jgi:hypothetical protein
VQTSLNPFNGDHVSFIRKNVPAVLMIEGTDDVNRDIHSLCETLGAASTSIWRSVSCASTSPLSPPL